MLASPAGFVKAAVGLLVVHTFHDRCGILGSTGERGWDVSIKQLCDGKSIVPSYVRFCVYSTCTVKKLIDYGPHCYHHSVPLHQMLLAQLLYQYKLLDWGGVVIPRSCS